MRSYGAPAETNVVVDLTEDERAMLRWGPLDWGGRRPNGRARASERSNSIAQAVSAYIS